MTNLTERRLPEENEVLQSSIEASRSLFFVVNPVACSECTRLSNLIIHRDGKARCACCDEAYLQKAPH